MTEPFTGIGGIGGNTPFTGTYDGNGLSISNMVFSNKGTPAVTDNRYRGLFNSAINGAVIKDVTLDLVGMASDAENGEFGGTLVGYAGKAGGAITTISGCTVTGKMKTNTNFGGIATRCYGNLVITNCVSDLDITLDGKNGAKLGGIVGHEQGDGMVIVDTAFTGSITEVAGSTMGGVGGIFGHDTSSAATKTIKGCTVDATFTFADTPANFGTLVGSGSGPFVIEGNNIPADVLAGGVAIDGLNFATVAGDVATLISNDQVVVAAAAPAPQYKVMSTIATRPITLDTVGQTIAFDVALNEAFKATITADGVGVETNLVENLLTYTAVALPPFLGSGTEADPFQIWTVADLKKLDELVDGGEAFVGMYFKQMANIDFDGVIDWAGIGTVGGSGKTFSGIYDGDNKSILNLTTTSTGNYCGILFNNVDNAEIKNLIVDVYADASGGFSAFGGANTTVFSNVTVKGTILGTHHCGGFTSFGQWSDGASTFIDCTNEAAVASSKSAGGFQGKPQTGATYIRCVNKGTIGADGKMGGDGGLAGFASSGSCNYVGVNVNEGVVLGNFTQFSGVASLDGTLIARDDQLAGVADLNFANKAAIVDGLATLISNDQVVVGGEYKVMSTIATILVTLNAVDQTIAFDNALYPTFAATITADGVAVTTNTAGTVTTYTAVELPTPSEDWPDVPADVEGKSATEQFPNLPAAFEGADAGLVAAWAKGKGNLAYADMATASIDAFLLDCAESEIETEAAKFKIVSIENINGEWVVKVTGEKTEGQNYTVNAKVDIIDVTTTFDEEETAAGETKGFFKATLAPFIK